MTLEEAKLPVSQVAWLANRAIAGAPRPQLRECQSRTCSRVSLVALTHTAASTMELSAMNRMESDEWNFEGANPCRPGQQRTLRTTLGIV